jgi:gamma-glutamylcyclotransferase (GGCT)/AIG2-like uncharacterized protein YtfP
MLNLGAYPAVVPGAASRIVGEVFEVDAAILARCDRLEGHPRLYRRDIVTLDDGTQAWMYVFVDGARYAPIITSGSWLDAQPDAFEVDS